MNETEFKITDKQYQDAEHIFTLYDKKGDGYINTKDFGQVFKGLGLAVEATKLKEWADDADEEANGCITWEQFKPYFEIKMKADEDERELKEAFRVLDKKNEGEIAVEDLRWILKSLGEGCTDQEIEDMIAETDTDGSGTVDYDEFRNLMCSE